VPAADDLVLARLHDARATGGPAGGLHLGAHGGALGDEAHELGVELVDARAADGDGVGAGVGQRVHGGPLGQWS
jgi:hypothetical protein